LQQPGAEHALWSILGNGIPSLTGAQLDALHASAVPKSVVFGANDPQYDKATPTRVAARIGAPSPTIVPAAAHLTMIASPQAVAAAIRTLCVRAAASLA
jgi:pimeloyl-ACP methyl ester carboxylesterase